MATRLLKYLWFSGLLCFVIVLQTSAQTPVADTAVRSAAIDNAIQVYHQFTKMPTALYNGPEYMEYFNTIHEGHPFFGNTEFGKSYIIYDNILYEDVFLKYDLVKNIVVLKFPRGVFGISLFNDKIAGFNIEGNEFIHIINPTGAGPVTTGIYQRLYNGASAVLLKKEKKSVQSTINPFEGVRNYIESHINYYTQTSSGYVTTNTKRALLGVLKDKRSELQQYIRKNRLKFRRSLKETSFISIVTYYNSLKK